ncbi:MAG: hypothetical protein JSV51_01865 [Candidatus Bathyarchaeota archaeon]|nr:MAG: hypothetical protein JSV51_01865 [Candidatus Bathyarchaeota archaeon]
MVDLWLAAWHSMLTEMHGGMLTLATICLLATVIDRIHLRMRRTNDKRGSFWSTDSVMGKLSRYTEPVAYIAGIGGIIGLVTSAIVGIYVWPSELITTSALGLNKVMFFILATELWIIFVCLRSKYGENLWKNSAMATVYTCLGILGFLFMVIAGSLGAHMSGKLSVIDPIFALFGIDPMTFGVTGVDFVIILIGVSLVLLVVPMTAVLYFQRRKRLKGNAKT